MITLEEITQSAGTGESETVEFKATTGQRTEAARSLSAMLNGEGGSVLFGVLPDGKVVGQQVGAKTLEDIALACSAIYPRYSPSIERVVVSEGSGREVLVVTVLAGDSKPYSYRGRYYVRSGSSTVTMPDEVQVSMVMERAHSLDRWEVANSDRDLSAIDDDEVCSFRDDVIAARRARFNTEVSAVDVLRALNLLDSDDQPNRGAIALFGKADAFAGRYPTLGCRLVAVAGTDLGEEFHDDVLIEANVFVSLRRAMLFCDEHLHRPVRINGELQAEITSEIPPEVVREALANAFGHRDYATGGLVQVRIFYDRLEVWSPGGLHFGLKPADLYVPHSSYPWNPNVLGCLYRRGIVEQLGSGTLRMTRMCIDTGLGRPVFTAGNVSVTCTIPRRGYWLKPNGSSTAVDKPEQAVLATLAKGPAGRGRLAAQTGVASPETRETLVRLHKLGFVEVKGHGRGSRWMLKNS